MIPEIVTLAFDPNFSNSGLIFAASDASVTNSSKERLFRFIIGKSTTWQSIDSTLAVGSILNQLAISGEGMLYAANSMANGGVERTLSPTYPLGLDFETVSRGLDSGATLTGLWQRGKELWAIDTKNTRLETYTDSLGQPVVLSFPPEGAQGVSTENVTIDWQGLKGATKYKWQLDVDTDFSVVPTGFEDDTGASSVRLPALDVATSYYWRVRAIEPILSPWSAKWCFTTILSGNIQAPELLSPKAGEEGVRIRPVFQWSAIAGAEGYELLVSTDVFFSNPSVERTSGYSLPVTAWESDKSLAYDTTYYWEVRAVSSSSYSDWSAVGAFTTELFPQPELSPPQGQPPSPSSVSLTSSSTPPPPTSTEPLVVQLIIPNGLMYLAVALLLIAVLLLVTLLLLVMRMKGS